MSSAPPHRQEGDALLQIETINSGTFHPSSSPAGEFNLGCAQLRIFTLKVVANIYSPNTEMRGSATLRDAWWLSRRSIMISSFAHWQGGHLSMPLLMPNGVSGQPTEEGEGRHCLLQ